MAVNHNVIGTHLARSAHETLSDVTDYRTAAEVFAVNDLWGEGLRVTR